MFRLGFVLCLCLYGIVAYRMDYELAALDREYARGVPGTNNNIGGSSTSSECKKDIWILWDNSWSVGQSTFEDKVKPFLKELIQNPQLNVGPGGTHLGFFTFSTQIRTKVLRDIAEDQAPSALLDWLDSLQYWRDVAGDGTRTGMALREANYKLFPQENPQNHRADVSDVIILFTDGEPIRRRGDETYGEKYKSNRDGERMLATDMAEEIKNKDITLVGLAVGTESTLTKFRGDMMKWSSENKYFEANKDSLNTIINQLISASCIDPGECLCDNIETEAFAAQGAKALIDWVKPTLKCASGRQAKLDSEVVEPPVSPPHEFAVGQHTVTYTYRYMRGSKVVPQKCSLRVDVNECKCPSIVRVNAEIPSGADQVDVSWTVPKPNCPATLKSVSPRDASAGRGKFPIGEYEFNYHYEHSSPSGTFSLACPVVVKVTGRLCGGVGFSNIQECCCGKVFDYMTDHICCGQKYIYSVTHRCAEFYTVVPKTTA